MPRGKEREERPLKPESSDFLEDFEEYISSMVGINLPSTINEHSSKIRRFVPVFEELQTQGKISSIRPADLTEQDVRYFVQGLRDRDIAPRTQQKYLQLLNCYLRHVNNMAVEIARKKLKITEERVPIEALSVNEIGKVFKTIEEMEGWRGSVARGMIYLAFQTLARPTEIRTALYKDLDIISRRFYVRNPKGKGTFAAGQYVDMLRPDFMPQIERYVADREFHLLRRGKSSAYLFPNLYGEINDVYSANAQRVIMREVSHRSGVDFSLKTFRATGADLIISADPSKLFIVSAQLRHGSIATTQKYYADIQRSSVARQLGDTYTNIKIPKD